MVTSRSTIAKMYVTSYSDGVMKGFIHNEYYDKSIPFVDSLDFLKKLESLFDTLSFPSRFEDYRRFKAPAEKRTRKITQERADTAMSEKDSKATFVIHVQFRQNATWQGTIQWVDENKQQSFRSTLEMIRLVDDALEKNGSDEKISWDK